MYLKKKLDSKDILTVFFSEVAELNVSFLAMERENEISRKVRNCQNYIVYKCTPC